MVELEKTKKNTKTSKKKVDIQKSRTAKKAKTTKLQTETQKLQYVLFFTDATSELYQFWCQQSKQTLPLNKVLELTENYQLL